jgi:hypothetical protein
MASMPSSYRETDATSSSEEHRYSPSEFHTLTNRRISSPPFTPDSALEPLPASNDGRTVVTSDKRATTRSPVSHSVRITQASHHHEGIRKSSWSSVKEEDGGKLPQNFRKPHTFTYSLPKPSILIDHHAVRNSTILPRIRQRFGRYTYRRCAWCRQSHG